MIVVISNKINEGEVFEVEIFFMIEHHLFFNEIEIVTSLMTKLRKIART